MNFHQRGALSLWWCAILVALGAALFAFRDGRNVFAESWYAIQSTLLGQKQHARRLQARSFLTGENPAIRKCTINGSVVFSNIDCRSDNSTSSAVELHDSRGIEAPKPAVPAAQQTGATDNQREKLLDKALEKEGGG